MSDIILIETSTSLCSTAVSRDGKVVCSRKSDTPRAHASMTAVFIKEMMDELGLKVSDCDAVCLSSGPGSYTGLRVGSSTAKGLCFGAGIPLLSVCTLDILACQAIAEGRVPSGCRAIVPMIDARRMEVYTATYDPQGNRLSEVTPLVVEPGAFSRELEDGPVVFIGDGALKCREPLGDNQNAIFIQECPEAASMAFLAEKAFKEKRFENTAYFEPFYLKEFVATVSKKSLF